MNAKSEMMKKMFLDRAYIVVDDIDFDDGTAAASFELIEKIRQAILESSETSDFETVEKIIDLLEKYGINCAGAHDFG